MHAPTLDRTFHFDMGGMADCYDRMYVKVPGARVPLIPHTDETRAAARRENPAVAALSADNLARLTHFAADVPVPQKAPFMLRVHNDDGSNGVLPTLLAVSIEVPVVALIEHRIGRMADLRDRPLGSWQHFGLTAPATLADDRQMAEFMSKTDLIKAAALSTAGALAFSHPQLASTSNRHAALISDLFINRSADIGPLASYIAQMPRGHGFALSTQITDDEGTATTLNPALVDMAGGEVSNDTILCTYALNPALIGSPDAPPKTNTLATLLNSALVSMTNDPTLRNSHWSVNQAHQVSRFHPGVTAKGVVDSAAAALYRSASRRAMSLATEADATGGYEFTTNNKTPGHGMEVHNDSITFDTASQMFSIDVLNTYMRTLATHVKFYDDQGNALDKPPSQFTELQELALQIKEMLGLDTEEEFLGFVYAVYTIMDIPVKHGDTTVRMYWPEEAASADILFGGIGTSKWNTTADMLGVIATILFQFVSPFIFLIAGAWVTHSDWYKKLMKNKGVLALVIIIALILGKLTGLLRFEANFAVNLAVNKVIGYVFGNLGAWLAKKVLLLLTDGVETLFDFYVVKITVSDIIDAIPFVGWTAEIAGVAATAGALIEASVDVLSSPATYTVNVTRALKVVATVSPDPLHGSEGNPPIWPTEATRFKAVLSCKHGTATTIEGALPTDPAERDQPVVVTFDRIPSGGQLQITFGVYSDTDWLAGNWTGPWVDAVLTDTSQTLDLSGAIIENLVPLTAQTQYLWSQVLTYSDEGGHQWSNAPDARPDQTQADLNADGLSQVVSITLNNGAYMLGYTWQAAHQNVPVQGTATPSDATLYTFQNINTLSDPESALKFSSSGFAAATFLAYEQFGPEPLFNAPASVQSDLDAGTVDSTLATTFADAGYPLPDDLATVVVTVLEETVEWTLTLPDQTDPTYQLNRQSDGDIVVFLYPTDVVGQNNYFLDSSGTVGQLRKVILDDTTPFDMDQTTSHGGFAMTTIDSLVIHPANYAIAVSFDNHRMEIVPISQDGTSDEDAPLGTVVSGKGIRQGLMMGPRAVAITQDGRILVLESLNRRVQAFDINGNPNACFKAADVTQLAAADYAADLDAGLVSVALRSAFAVAGFDLTQHWTLLGGADLIVDVTLAENGQQYQLALNSAPLSTQWTITNTDDSVYQAVLGNDQITVTPPTGDDFALPSGLSDNLDYGFLGAEGVAAFAKAGVTISPQATVAGNGLYVDPSECEAALCAGAVPDAIVTALATAQVALPARAPVVASVRVTVQAQGTVWLINDAEAGRTYSIDVDPDDTTRLDTIELSPLMTLQVDGQQQAAQTRFHADDFARVKAEAETAKDQYLDLATEMKGYIYVLGYTGDPADPANYFLDIYDPLGIWLSRTPDPELSTEATGVNGSRIAVDMWRNLFTLNYQQISGPGGRVEPSVSMWVPTTPQG
ncbi:hypothetical protein ACOXXX_06560 [Thalassococcus sp. BH17M4-6]|uniref:hypothetical protein n=1 Tax=Thalassococcus sp. BH17M4-6 TaxID=3413148 RepID=UPI003BE6CB86